VEDEMVRSPSKLLYGYRYYVLFSVCHVFDGWLRRGMRVKESMGDIGVLSFGLFVRGHQ
jgi:hypothetical protein